MPGPLEGIRVLEGASYLAVPNAAVLLTDLGATTIKVEPRTGDTWRAYRIDTYGWRKVLPVNPMFDIDNRGKRSIALELDHPEGQDVVRRLAASADVFMTNLVPSRQERYGLSYEVLSAGNPRLVYLSFSGYGEEGPESDRLGFDYHAFWSRSGLLSLMSDETQPPPNPPTGVGDHLTAPLLVAGVLTALFERERSGRGQRVSTSLLNSGMWALGSVLSGTLAAGHDQRVPVRQEVVTPLRQPFRAGDGRWLMLGVPERYWPRLCTALGRPELATDPRFATHQARSQHCTELVPIVDAAFATATLEEWGRRLDAQGLLWAPIQTPLEVTLDPQVRANGYLVPADQPESGYTETLNTPLRFSRSEVGPKGPAPQTGQHTEEVLLEEGYSWEDIGRLRDAGAI